MTGTETDGLADDADPAELARARADAYALLAAAFDGEIDVLVAAMDGNGFDSVADRLPDTVNVDPLRRDDPDAEALRVGYDNLFVVPGPHYVPPFASAHADDPTRDFESDSRYHDEGSAGELFGSPAVSVSAHYERLDFTPSRGDGIPDHLAAEFEFLAALARREAAFRSGTDSGDDAATVAGLRRAQHAFLRDGLDWLGDFAAAVEREDAAEGVFAALARFAAAVVKWDRRALAAAGEGTVGTDTAST